MNTCAECIHAEMCRWMEEVERDGCDFFDGDPWIPVSERLPEDTGYYLTTTKYGEVYCDYWTGISFDRSETVIAWMPLPAPYEPQESEE